MELNDLRSLMTVISLVTFLGIIWWAYSRKNKGRFDEAAQLPFTEDEQEGAAGEVSQPRQKKESK